jgi:hypothetical protein
MPYIVTWLQSNIPNLRSLSIRCEEVGPEHDPDFGFQWAFPPTSFDRWKPVDEAFREIRLPLLLKVRLLVRWTAWQYPQPHRIREVMPYLATQRSILEIVNMNNGWRNTTS